MSARAPLQKVSCSACRSAYNTDALLEELHGSAESLALFDLGPYGVDAASKHGRTTCSHCAYSATAFALVALKIAFACRVGTA